MKKGTVHFTLGDDAGKLLMQIAQEALLYELDPEKAIKVITTSLMGCPDNIALKILKGDMVCVVMDDKQTIEIATYDRFYIRIFPDPTCPRGMKETIKRLVIRQGNITGRWNK